MVNCRRLSGLHRLAPHHSCIARPLVPVRAAKRGAMVYSVCIAQQQASSAVEMNRRSSRTTDWFKPGEFYLVFRGRS